MRIDMLASSHRPWYFSLGLKFARWRVGAVPGADGVIRPPEVELGRERFLSAEGATDPALRRGVEAFVTAQWEHYRENTQSVPAELKNYLKTLALYAIFVLEVIVTFLSEGALQATLVMGIITGIIAVIWGVLLRRFVFVKT